MRAQRLALSVGELTPVISGLSADKPAPRPCRLPQLASITSRRWIVSRRRAKGVWQTLESGHNPNAGEPNAAMPRVSRDCPIRSTW